MSNIKLYMFQSGTQLCKVHDIKMNQGNGADYEIPVPWFLLVHPKGNVIIDGGLAAEGLSDPRAYWGASVDSYKPVMTESQGCVAQLATLGLTPENVGFVVLSHLHSDHTGAIGRFPRARHIVQRREYEYAFTPDWFAAGAYARKDFDRPGLCWQFLEGEATDHYDLFGDGVLQIVFTPGHTLGHQSILVTLPNSGPSCWPLTRSIRWITGTRRHCPASWPPPWIPCGRCVNCVRSPSRWEQLLSRAMTR